jgi:tRNA (guanine37-N1)-methyltransferase
MSEDAAALRVDIITTFPEMVRQAAGCSILGRAQAAGRLDLRVHDLRDYAEGRHRQTDDYPFGGGAGMVMTPGPVFTAVEAILADAPAATPVLLMAPDGERFDQAMARELAALPRYILLCGHYEGMDERVREALVTRAVSIGDFVLTGGELPALVVLDATTRLLPGVLGNEASTADETFGEAGGGLLLEYPHYTRPADFRGMSVPDVLLSGHHAKIANWRRQQALARTRARRPDLWEKFLPLSRADQKLLDAYDAERLNHKDTEDAKSSL